MFQNIGEIIILIWKTILRLPAVWEKRQSVMDQLYDIGNASLLMACILSAFVGGILALQIGPTLSERGISNFIGQIVGLGMCRELAPVTMAILITGRVGSAMAAELGSMVINQEIDALRSMNIDPIRYLVLPRLVAITIAMPVLVIFSDLVGWIAGAFISHYNYQVAISFQAYFISLRNGVEFIDILKGLIKAIIFGGVIGAICCHQGLATFGGPRGVGRSVTKAVVNSIVMILILDYFLTRILMQWK